jgi:hypothetical protein
MLPEVEGGEASAYMFSFSVDRLAVPRRESRMQTNPGRQGVRI